ncbi:MAG: ribosome silencing factor [Planctomycetaceae bacterium]|nr:ribosome silencing factor [Planctomycetaceae bacterium]
MAEPKKTAKKTTKKAVKNTEKKAVKKTVKKAVKKAVKKTTKTAAKIDPLQEDRAFAIEAAKIARDRHCRDVVVLDLSTISPATYFYVIATGTSDRQSRTVADEISKMARQRGHQRFGMAGYEYGHWILLDFVTVVVHIFDAEHRDYYSLEMLWGDGKKLEIDA